jgi:hypothetical protein
MARILIGDAQAWAESTKLNITVLDSGLVDQVETQVLARLTPAFPDIVSTWTSSVNTPAIVKTVIAMFYVAWFYDRQYSEEQEALNDYAVLLRAQAESLIAGIIDGSIDIPNVDPPALGGPDYYPNDLSSSLSPTTRDRSLGDAKFSMNQIY